MKISGLVLVICAPLLFFACKKWKDNPGVRDPRIDERTYCNDPEAINYNWNFPGKPDNTTCIFPSSLFEGTFTYKDSVYFEDHSFDSVRSQTVYTLHFIPVSKSRFVILGFCPTDSLKFTAERTTFHANADTVMEAGQFVCRVQDTLTGTITSSLTDTTKLLINFTVVSDTGINYHMGTAIKQ